MIQNDHRSETGMRTVTRFVQLGTGRSNVCGTEMKPEDSLCGRTVHNFRFADDFDITPLTKEDLQRITDNVDWESRKID